MLETVTITLIFVQLVKRKPTLLGYCKRTCTTFVVCSIKFRDFDFAGKRFAFIKIFVISYYIADVFELFSYKK